MDLNGVDISVSQVIAFLLTIVASYFSARFGASESRRQHQERLRVDRLIAAAELIRLVHDYVLELETIIIDIENHQSSGGHTGKEHTSFRALPEKAFEVAAKLGEPILADVIRLAATWHLASDSMRATFEYVDPDAVSQETRGWAAKVVIDGFALLNKIAPLAEIPLTFTASIKQEQLSRFSAECIGDLSSASLPVRHGRAAAWKVRIKHR